MKNAISHGLRRNLPLLMSAGVAAVAVLTAMSSSAGIQGSGFRNLLAIGTVTDTGSGNSKWIVVNGTSYSTSNAVFQIDGRPGVHGQIHAGDIVSLAATDSGSGSEAVASQVTFNGSVRGKVSGIDTQASTLFLLGQTVRVNSHTVFGSNMQPGALAGLQNGATVEISGFTNSAGELVASRIDAKGQSNMSRVVGTMRTLDPTGHSFYINALRVDYGTAEVDGALINSTTVSVQGLKFAPDGTLVANRVSTSAAPHGQPGSIGRIQGLVTNYSAASYFELNGQAVIVGPNTQLNLAVPLGIDSAVTVSGTFDTNGALLADAVQTSN